MDSDEIALRCHRAKSWIGKAEKLAEREPQDLDSQFIFLWIALNALYGQPRVRLDKQSDKTRPPDDLYHLGVFIKDLCDHAPAAALVRRRLAPELENAVNLLKNPFLLRDYWEEGLTEATQAELWNDIDNAKRDWTNGRISHFLKRLSRRLYILRNQIFHGCSTDRSTSNRDSLETAVPVMTKIVPALLDALKAHGATLTSLGAPFPPLKSPTHPRPVRAFKSTVRISK